MKKRKAFDSSYLISKSHFEEDGTTNYLVFQPMYRYFKRVDNSNYILLSKSKGVPDESIKASSAPYNFLNPVLEYLGAKPRVRFSGNRLKQDKITYTHGDVVNIYIVYEVNNNDYTSTDPTIENCLFGAVSLSKMLISIGTNILDMDLDFIDMDLTDTLVVELEEM